MQSTREIPRGVRLGVSYDEMHEAVIGGAKARRPHWPWNYIQTANVGPYIYYRGGERFHPSEEDKLATDWEFVR